MNYLCEGRRQKARDFSKVRSNYKYTPKSKKIYYKHEEFVTAWRLVVTKSATSACVDKRARVLMRSLGYNALDIAMSLFARVFQIGNKPNEKINCLMNKLNI